MKQAKLKRKSSIMPTQKKESSNFHTAAPMQPASAAGWSTDEQRERVAIGAYYKAQKRGFAPGDDLADWFEAEDELRAGCDPRVGD